MKKVETKTQILNRKNAEIACLQARIRGIKAELSPVAAAKNFPVSKHVFEAVDLCDIAIDQAETFFQKDN